MKCWWLRQLRFQFELYAKFLYVIITVQYAPLHHDRQIWRLSRLVIPVNYAVRNKRSCSILKKHADNWSQNVNTELYQARYDLLQVVSIYETILNVSTWHAQSF
jgi:hypothetical protein